VNNAKTFVRFGLCPLLLSVPLGAATCESLASLKRVNTKITAAQVVAAGAFVPPGPAPAAAVLAPFKSLPAFCRVQGVIQPSSDSHIEFEVWMRVSGWNRDYMGVGNGGFAGSIIYALPPVVSDNAPGMAEALAAGFAVSSTDTGHEDAQVGARWALGIRKKLWITGTAPSTRLRRNRKPSSAHSTETLRSIPISTVAPTAGARR
jgi:feruloyl esterase